MPGTWAETSDSRSRRSFTSASNAAAKPGSEASSRRIAHRLPKAFDQRRHLGRAQLERGAIDDQPRRQLADHRLLGERILDQRDRSEECRVGTACLRTCCSWWSPCTSNQNTE